MKQIRPSSVTFLHQDILSSVKFGQLLPIAVRLTSSKPPAVLYFYSFVIQYTVDNGNRYEEQTVETS